MLRGIQRRQNMANALEKIEQLEKNVGIVANRVNEIGRTVEQILPIVDALVAVVGKDTVLAEAQRIAKEARDTHVQRVFDEQKKLVAEGKLAESELSTATSLLFVDEKVGEETSLRLLPISALDAETAPKAIGLKIGDKVDIGGETVEITVKHIFTPVVEAA
jgi:hypothetical protein